MLTKQEMFDKAWNGLRSQGFARAHDGFGCRYAIRDDVTGEITRRCAWGWVDPEGTLDATGGVFTLRSRGIGLAKGLTGITYADSFYRSDMAFAEDLQEAHDSGHKPEVMQRLLKNVAARFNLTVPE